MTPHLVLTQGDPAGIGPEILLRLAAEPPADCRLTFIAEQAAFEPLRGKLPNPAFEALEPASLEDVEQGRAPSAGRLAWVEPPARALEEDEARVVVPGAPSPADAHASLAALDLGARLVRSGAADALVTAPLSKSEISRHVATSFRGHTDYLAEQAGLERYGRDYLMAFLAPSLRVALLSTHVPLSRAIELVTPENLEDAVRCLHRHAPGRLAVAGLDPHAGEGGLLGSVDEEVVRPTVERLRAEGLDVHGPLPADSLFARAARGAFDWVLALYHDQGLIAVKTAAFGDATNWTLGLPYLRTSVDHGTAYDIAGRGIADASSLFAVVKTTLELVAERR